MARRSVARRHRAMLPSIARQNQSPPIRLNQLNQLVHIAHTHLSSFVENHDRVRRQLTRRQQLRQRLRRQTLVGEVLHLLPLGSEHQDRVFHFNGDAMNLVQRMTLAGTGGAAEQRDKISAG